MLINNKTDVFEGLLTFVHSDHHVNQMKTILKKLEVELKLSDNFYSVVYAKMEENQSWMTNNLDCIDEWLDKELQIMTNSAGEDK